MAFPIVFLLCESINFDNDVKIIFLNTILLVALVENVYFTGIDMTMVYYLWGMPIVLVSIMLTKIKSQIANVMLSLLLVVTVITQYYFNLQNYDKDIYTYSDNDSVVANYELLSKYFKNIHNNEFDVLQYSTVIVPLSENSKNFNLNNLDIISKNSNYIILGEHDNMNNVTKRCPYINDDRYLRKSPWYVFAPNMNSRFRYFSKDDIFYSLNIGATVNACSPLIWEYDNCGKPVVLAGFKKNNSANVYIFGDSDFFVNKLMPYNINFVSVLLNRSLGLYFPFIILVVLTNIFVLKRNKYISSMLFILMIMTYFFPYNNNCNSELKLYSQNKYLTAHTTSHSSSSLNFLAQNNIAVLNSSQEDAQVQIIKSNQRWENIKNSKLIYLLPNTLLTINGDTLFCSNIKIGTENRENNEIIDARVLILNNHVTNTSFYVKDGIHFVCTGSPQLNYRLTRSIVLNEK